jgi:hypothetical protein
MIWDIRHFVRNQTFVSGNCTTIDFPLARQSRPQSDATLDRLVLRNVQLTVLVTRDASDFIIGDETSDAPGITTFKIQNSNRTSGNIRDDQVSNYGQPC